MDSQVRNCAPKLSSAGCSGMTPLMRRENTEFYRLFQRQAAAGNRAYPLPVFAPCRWRGFVVVWRLARFDYFIAAEFAS
jgi:hypothetical protein